MSYSVGAVSLGCNKNRVDTETALGLLRDRGFRIVSDPSQADVLMVNTCGFIDPAKEESINIKNFDVDKIDRYITIRNNTMKT